MNVGVAKSLRKYCKLELAFGLEIIGLLLCTESSVELGMVKPEPYTSGLIHGPMPWLPRYSLLETGQNPNRK
jgi:hypothetical protein